LRRLVALFLVLVLSLGWAGYGLAQEASGEETLAGEAPASPMAIRYSTTDPTNGAVTAYLESGADLTITNNEGERAYTFADNGQFEFCFVDAAGESGSIMATVSWIDTVAPNATISYSSTDETWEQVIATVSFDEPNVVVTNNGGECNRVFDANGEFRFEFMDAAGNKGTALAAVENIRDTSAEPNLEAMDIAQLGGVCIISGSVLDADGVPQTNTYVRVSDLSGQSVVSTRTDGLGSFQLSVLPGSYRIGADISIGLSYTTVWYGSQVIQTLSSPITVDDSGVSGLEIRYPELSSIAGQVRDASGEPLIGVEVQAHSVLSSGRVAWCDTDTEGHYRLLVPAGSYRVMMSTRIGEDWISLYAPHTVHPELATVVDVTTMSPAEGLALEMPVFASVSGQVTDAQGSGVANASITVVDISLGRTAVWGKTDAQGCYTVQVPEGSYRVRAYVGGLVVYTPDVLSYSLAEPISITSSQPINGMDIAIPEVRLLSGSVLGANGLPISAAYVKVIDASGNQISSGQTDMNGQYHLAVPTGSYRVGAEVSLGDAKGTIWLGSTVVMSGSAAVPVENENVIGLDISIPAMYQISGKVLDSQGVPQSSSYVRFVDSVGRFVCSTRTSSLGEYRVLLPDGAYHVGADILVGSSTMRVWYGGFTDSSYSPAVTVSGIDVSDVDISPPALASIAGQVTDSSGDPLVGIAVTAYDTLAKRSVITTRTDANGNYTLLVQPGSYKIVADLATDGTSYFWYGDVPGINEASVIEVAGETQADIHCAELFSASGTVLDSNGAPIVGQQVFTYPLSGGWRNASAETDALGRYTLKLPAGQYKLGALLSFGSAGLEVYRGGGLDFSMAPVQNVCEAVENWEIQIPLLGTISGVVSSQETGPLSDVSVSAIETSSGAYVAWSRTDLSGAYSLHVPEGSYAIRATVALGASSSSFYSPGTSAISNAATISLLPGGSVDHCDILVPVTRKISGRVQFASDGQPPAEASINLFDNPNGRSLASATMDDLGSFELQACPGTYYLAVTIPNGTSRTRIWRGPTGASADAVLLPVTEQDLTDLDVIIPSLLQINGCVVDASGAPMVNDEVMAVASGASAVAWAWTDQNGAYSLMVPSGEYFMLRQQWIGTTVVNMYAPGTTDSSQRTVINIEDSSVSGVDMQVPELVNVSGRVTDADGSPVSQVAVEAYEPLNYSSLGFAQTDEQGRYSLYLPVGSYQIAVRVSSGGVWNQFFLPGCLNATAASTIEVLPGSPVSGADIQLPRLYPVTGTVYSSDGTPLAGVIVRASDAAIGAGVGAVKTDASGQFTFALPAGSYRFNTSIVDGTGWLNVYHGEYFGDVSGSAPTVGVSGPTTGVDIHYPAIGWISGHVLDEEQRPVPDALVVANEISGQTIRGAARSDAAGYYCMPVPAGLYEVGLCADDTGVWHAYAETTAEAGISTDAVNITLGQELARAVLSIPGVDVGAGISFTAKVIATGLEGLRALEMRLSYDPERLLPIAVRTTDSTSGFLLESNLSQPGVIIIAMANGTPISGDLELLQIDFEPVLGVTGTTSLDFALATLNDGALPVTPSSGAVVIRQLFDLSGQVTYCDTGRPVSGVDLSLIGATSSSAVTDSQGAYSITDLPAGDYTLTPAKSDDVSGITAHDAALILMATVEKLNLSASQQIAADVDGSGRIGAMDASYVLQHAVGLLPLPFPDSERVWDFIPRSHQISGSDADLLDQDFIAVLIGDVSGNWSGVAAMGALELDSGINLALATTRSLPGENAVLSLSLVGGDEPIYSADLSVRFDPGAIAALSLLPESLPAGVACASNDSIPGLLRIGIASTTALNGRTELCRLLIQPIADLCGERIALELIQADVNEVAAASITHGQVIVAMRGDANLDNQVNVMDLSTLALAYGTRDAGVDLNGDGVIDLFDLVSVAKELSL